MLAAIFSLEDAAFLISRDRPYPNINDSRVAGIDLDGVDGDSASIETRIKAFPASSSVL